MALFCAANLMAAYVAYRLWYALPEVITFNHELGMGMADELCSHAIVRELLEIIESTLFEALPNAW